MRIIIILFIFVQCLLFSNERSLDKLQTLQNFDGSFGKVAEDRILTTSSVLMSYISQNLIVKYSETTSGAVNFLLKESDGLCKMKPSPGHLSALRALSEYYGISRQNSVRAMCLRLKNCIYKDFSGKRWILTGRNRQYFIDLSLALFACDSSKASLVDRESMIDLGIAAVREFEMTYETGLFFRLHSVLWNLDRRINAGQIKLGSDLQKLLSRLDSNSSKERKKAFAESQSLNIKEKMVLIEALKVSESLELKMVALDITANMKYSEILKCDADYSKDSIPLMYIFSHIHFNNSHPKAGWADKTLNIFKKAGEVESPLKLDALKGHKYDQKIIEIASAVTAVNSSFHPLPSFRKLSSHKRSIRYLDDKNEDITNPVIRTVNAEEIEEEGLDLVE